MKNKISTHFFGALLCLLASATLSAQTMTEASFPTEGDVFTLTQARTAGFNPGSAGNAVTWNFASLIPNDTLEVDSFLAPLSTPYGALLSHVTVADHVQYTVNGNVLSSRSQYIYYYDNTSVGAFQRAANVLPDTVIYAPLGSQFAYPYSYGSTNSGFYYAHYPTSSGTATETGYVYDTADGRGTLITPLGTSTNVLRVVSHRQERDTVVVIGLGTYPGTTTVVYYTWLQPSSYFPIMWYTVTTENFPSFPALNLTVTSLGYRAGYPSTPVAPIAVSDTATLTQPGSVTIDVLANDVNNNPPDTICITGVWGSPTGWETIQGCSQVVFHPLDSTFTGLDTFYYVSCDTRHTSLCDTGMVVVDVLPAPGQVQAGFISTGGTCSASLLVNASLSATSVTWYLTEVSPAGFDTAISDIDTISPYALHPQSADATYLVCIMARAGTDSAEICDTVSLICTGIPQITAAAYSIYPDPASDIIHLDLSHMDQATTASLAEIAVYDLLGQKIKALPPTQTAIPLSDLSDGIYMIAVLDQNQNKKILTRFQVLR
jgi:hypothetical protein